MLNKFIVITASNERQAEGYRHQIALRRKCGLLPEATFLVVPDPAGLHVGSGGSTLHVLQRLVEQFGASVLDAHILLIHSGGESMRVPQYSVIGKLFAPTTPDGSFTLFDEFMGLFGEKLDLLSPGMLVLSGDVLLQVEPENLAISDDGVTAISALAPAKTGTRHGVFCVDEDGIVTAFLHKQSLEVLYGQQAVARDGNVLIDTGAVFFGAPVVKKLYGLLYENGAYLAQLISDEARLSLYGDFLYPLARMAEHDAYMREKAEGLPEAVRPVRERIWKALHGIVMRAVSEPGARFLHLGTSEEVLSFMRTFTGEDSYLEASLVSEDTRIGRNTIVSQTELSGQVVPEDCVVHTLRLLDGRFVTRIWRIQDNPKEAKWFGRDLAGNTRLWDAKLFMPKPTIAESVDDALEQRERFLQGLPLDSGEERISLADGVRLADMDAAVDWWASVRHQKERFHTRQRILNATQDLPRVERFVQDSCDIRLPLRVNFAGGWTDTPPYCLDEGGCVLNMPILLHGEKPVHARAVRLSEPVIILESADLGVRQEFCRMEDLVRCDDPTDPFSLAKAALRLCGIVCEGENLEDKLQRFGGGLYLLTEVNGVPKGSGLGTSSILGAACLQAILTCFGVNYTKEQLVQWVLCMEQLMDTGGGWQDQAGGLQSGLCLLTSSPGDLQRVCAEPVALSGATVQTLESRLLLIFTGQTRLARRQLWQIMDRYADQDSETLQILRRFKQAAVEMKDALCSEDLEAFGQLMDEQWNLTKRLNPACSNDHMEKLLSRIDDLICGRMICGAGGGGYLVVLVKEGVSKRDIQERLSNGETAQVEEIRIAALSGDAPSVTPLR